MTADLLWALLQQELLLGELPGRIVYRPGIHRTPIYGRAVRLFRTIATLATVA